VNAAVTTQPGPRPSARSDRGPSIARLVEVELRKAVDTRAGLWMLTTIGLLSCVVVGLRLTLQDRSGRTLTELFRLSAMMPAILLAVVGILLVTGEWSQRTALSTFGLVPRRGRVVGAKLIAIVLLAVLVTLGGLVLALVAFGIGQGLGITSGGWDLPVARVALIVLAQCLGMLMGGALGLLLQHSAAAITFSFVLPAGWAALVAVAPATLPWAEWLDAVRTMAPLFEQVTLTGQAWAQLGVSTGVWLLLPLLAGLLRLHRAEIS
jgi:hypothetical protein